MPSTLSAQAVSGIFHSLVATSVGCTKVMRLWGPKGKGWRNFELKSEEGRLVVYLFNQRRTPSISPKGKAWGSRRGSLGNRFQFCLRKNYLTAKTTQNSAGRDFPSLKPSERRLRGLRCLPTLNKG